MEYGDYMPHGMCLLWQPWLVLLWAGSDLLIFLSYTAIPIALLTVLSKREDVPQSRLVALFASFILLCGLTHLFGIVTLWYPIYPYVAWVKLATGAVSMTTAIVLFRLVPVLISLPSPAAMAQANGKLRDEIAAHELTLVSLERQVEDRTRELRTANAALAVQTREAVHRSANLLAVVSSLAEQTARGTERTGEFLDIFLGRLQAMAHATRSIEMKDLGSTEIGRVVDARLTSLKETYGERLEFSGPALEINAQAAQQISLALHELATNTQKYGLSGSETTRVVVSWQTQGDDLELTWREHGSRGAFPDSSETSGGFGSKLLTRVVPAMLQGKATRMIDEDGMIYRLRVPLAAIGPDTNAGEAVQMAARIVDQNFGLDEN